MPRNGDSVFKQSSLPEVHQLITGTNGLLGTGWSQRPSFLPNVDQEARLVEVLREDLGKDIGEGLARQIRSSTEEEVFQIVAHLQWMSEADSSVDIELTNAMMRGNAASLQDLGRACMQFVANRIPKGNVLDVGSGNALLTHLLADAFPQTVFTASDPRGTIADTEAAYYFDKQLFEKILQAVRAHLDRPGIESYGYWRGKNKPKTLPVDVNRFVPSQPLQGFINAGMPNIPDDDGSFNAITAFRVFHYVKDPVGFMQEASRLLTSKGDLIINVQNPYLFGLSDPIGPILDHDIPDNAIGSETLTGMSDGFDITAEYFQRILVVAAMHGFHLERCGRSDWGENFDDDKKVEHEDEVQSEKQPVVKQVARWATREERLDPVINRHLARAKQNPDGCFNRTTAPALAYFHFQKRDPAKIKVPHPGAWLDYFNGKIVAPAFAKLDPFGCEILPPFSRKPPVTDRGIGRTR